MQVPKVKSDAECAMCLNATKMIQDELRDGNIQVTHPFGLLFYFFFYLNIVV